MASNLHQSVADMYKGIYIAVSGMVLRDRQIDTIAQNLANVSTTGYKRDDVSFEDYLMQSDTAPGAISDGRTMAQMGSVTTDFSSGEMIHTGNTLDVAINGDGFFSIEGDLYTRNGNFTVDSQGNVVDQKGRQVQGQGGAINLSAATGAVSIGPDGSVSVGGKVVDKIKVVKFDNPMALKRAGGVDFTSDTPPETVVDTPDVKQGFLEASNVNAVSEMMKMITAQREFESFQGVISSFDSSASKITNDLARA